MTRYSDRRGTGVRHLTRQVSWLTSILAMVMMVGSTAVVAQAPDWRVVNPGSFDGSMSTTAIVFVDGTPALHPDNVIAAFSGSEIRGVSKTTFVGGDQLFFLTIFGNTQGPAQNLTFKIYDAAVEEIRDINESVEFVPNQSLGELNRPFSLSAGSMGANRPSWTIADPGSYDQSMGVTASVVLDGVPSTHPGNMVAAFVGGVPRAVASPVWINGRQLFFLNVLGNDLTGTVRFRIYDATDGQVSNADELVDFAADATLGSVEEPFLLTDGPAGTNRPAWEVADAASFDATMSVAATVFVDGLTSSNTGNLLAAFSGAEVRGLASPRLVNGVQTFFLTIFGDAATGPLTLDFYDAGNDRVVDVNEQVSFEVDGAIGSVEVPLVLTSGPPPVNAPGWSVNPSDYGSNMSVTAALFVDGLPSSNPDNLIAAFVEETVRGVASPTLVNGVTLFYMTIYANADGERVTFKAFDAGDDRVRLLRETATFRNNDRIGETKVPFVLNTVKDAVDIAISKSADITDPVVGSDVEFTVTATNVGEQQATGVVVTDTAPTGMTFSATNTSQGSYSVASGAWNVGTLDAGQSATLSVTATVNQSGAITNTASVTNIDQPDTNPGNNAVSVTVGGEQADLQITKTVNTPSAGVGSQVTFVATVRNNGPSTATGITVSDQVSSGLRIDNATPGQGTFDGATATWSVGTLASGAQTTLTVVATLLSPGAQSNTASITGSGTADPNASNNTATASVSGEQVDIAVTKTLDKARPTLGGTVAFTITAANSGPSPATGVMILDALPVGLTFISASSSAGSYDDTSGEWSITSVAANSSATLTISALVDAPGVLVNTASLQSVDQPDSNPANNKSTATVSGQTIDLALTKTASSARPDVGDEVLFTVTLTNNGPGTATGITVSDAAPAGLTFASVTPDAGTYDATSGVWTVPQLPATASVKLVVAAVVNAPGGVTNTATVTGSDQPDTNPSNDSASRTVEGQLVDIAITKTVDRPAAAPGDSVTFTIRVSNNGPSVATGVEVADALPQGLTLRSSIASAGVFNAATGRWSVDQLGIGQQQTLRLTTRIESTGSYTNSVSVTASDQPDSDATNDAAEATVISESVDLAVTKTIDDPVAEVGSTRSFTIGLTNNGATTATGIEVTDVVPTGLALSNGSSAAGTFNAATGIWRVPSLPSGAQATLVVNALVTEPGELTNTVRLTALDQEDSEPSNNEAVATLSATSASTISGVVRDVVFDGDGPGSVLDNPPLASASVEILENGSVVEQTTTDAGGLFSFAATGTADRVIRITASGTVPETGVPVTVQKEIPLTDASRAYVIPLTIAVQKRSLIYELENLLIPASVLAAGGDPIPLVVSYDEDGTLALMQSWLANVGPNRDNVIESLARLVFAELVLSDLYKNALWMSHESSDVVFQLVRAYLLTQGVADDIREGVNERLLTVLELRVIRDCFEELRKLIKEVFLDAPLEEAISRLPSQCGPLLARLVRGILQEASTLSLVDQPDDLAIRDQSTTIGNQELLGWYVGGTQPDLDGVVTRADQFDTDGTADAAYAATRWIVDISNDATIDANQKADALQARTNLDQIVDRVLRHRSRERNLGNLVSLYQQLRKKKISYLGLSIATTMRQLKVIEGVDAPAGTLASTEATTPANSVASQGKAGTIAAGSSGTGKSSRSIGTSATGAAVSTASYRQAIAEIAQLASEGKKAEVIARYEPLVSLEHDLARSLRTAQAPVIAAAEKAAASVTNFEDALAAMVDATTETAVERAVFYAQLLQYAGDPAFSTDSLSAQVDSLNLSLDNAERQINALADLTSGIESRPYVVVLSIDIDNDQVSINDTLRVSAVIQNLGTLSAEDVTATLRTDASANAITATDISFGLIGASEEQTASWSMQIVDTTRSSGTFQIELVSSNALTSSSLGSYSFTRPTSIGVESVPGELPSDLALFHSYPNPFNHTTTFSFANPEHQRVTLTVYDVIGRQVAIVISEKLPVGNFRVPFRADGLASGMYVVRLEAGSVASSGTIVVAR